MGENNIYQFPWNVFKPCIYFAIPLSLMYNEKVSSELTSIIGSYTTMIPMPKKCNGKMPNTVKLNTKYYVKKYLIFMICLRNSFMVMAFNAADKMKTKPNQICFRFYLVSCFQRETLFTIRWYFLPSRPFLFPFITNNSTDTNKFLPLLLPATPRRYKFPLRFIYTFFRPPPLAPSRPF